MDPIEDPFSPGAGSPPPELAGRDEVIAQASIALNRIKHGRSERSPLMVGLRGVGKTVLLNEVLKRAEAEGFKAMLVEAQENQNLGLLLGPGLRRLLLNLSPEKNLGELARKGMRVLRGFLSGLKVGNDDIFLAFDEPPEKGVGDSGVLSSDLSDLFVSVAQAAREAGTAAAIIIDELQYLSEDELSALIMAVHKISQTGLPLILIAAGLPQLAGKTGSAKSYAERLFLFPTIGPLARADAFKALQEPVSKLGVEFEDYALSGIFERTQGYPYFLQEWGSKCWRVANRSPIDLSVVDRASDETIRSLDQNFFAVRFDRLTPREREYMRALAELGGTPQRSGDIASVLGVSTESVAPLRGNLIGKGMIYSPRHGDTAFTVPLFDQFMKRTVPQIPKAHRSRTRQASSGSAHPE